MAAAVVAHVDDQTVTFEFGQVAAVKLREAPRSHIGDVHVADTACGAFVHELAVGVHPRPVAQRAFVAHRMHQHAPRLAVALDVDRDVAVRQVDEQFVGRAFG